MVYFAPKLTDTAGSFEQNYDFRTTVYAGVYCTGKRLFKLAADVHVVGGAHEPRGADCRVAPTLTARSNRVFDDNSS